MLFSLSGQLLRRVKLYINSSRVIMCEIGLKFNAYMKVII